MHYAFTGQNNREGRILMSEQSADMKSDPGHEAYYTHPTEIRRCGKARKKQEKGERKTE